MRINNKTKHSNNNKIIKIKKNSKAPDSGGIFLQVSRHEALVCTVEQHKHFLFLLYNNNKNNNKNNK